MSPQNGTTIDLTVTSASDTISVDNNDHELVLTGEPIDTPKLSYKLASATSSSLISTPRTAFTSTLSSSSTLPAALTTSSNSNKKI